MGKRALFLILENLKKLFVTGAKIWIRIPVIPEVNDSVEEMQKISQYLKTCGKPETVELLAYHAMGENKYPALGRKPQSFKAPDAEKMRQLKEIFA